jgi:non-specific serine/threonine protein kinase/serine/threonine-protein kinase
MDSSAWAAVKREFARVQEAVPAARPALLSALDPAVRAEVESLLSALDAAPPLIPSDDVVFRPGAIVGPYRLLDEIGRGGMGTVFRAERADGELTRQIALKVAGGRIVAAEAERRFITEREILARLDHPHIVRLLDGGVAAGQRYFVMELAEGAPITRYVADRSLPLADRVRLFRDVCAAIHFAHQRLVLHRDIKPANVLVTAAGQVKVLDFGIAQIVQPETLTADTVTAMHPLSFACASPEQLRGEPLALTSDVYSLGTLLYEVLTGKSPQYQPGASTEEALRLVLEVDPPRPSTIAPAVPRDLDAIALKALAKRPADRYQSVADLDADLARWLEGRPVTAVPPGAWYFTTRFVRRNPLLTATAAALVVSVAVGLVTVTRQAQVAERRFEDARQLVHAVVFDIQPQMASIPATLPLRKTLIERTSAYLEAVSRDAGDNVALLRELANSYAQLGLVQGDAEASNLGDRAAAAHRFDQAVALVDRAVALAPDDAALVADAAVLYARQADFWLQGERRDDALGRSEAAVALADRSLALSPSAPAAHLARATALLAQGRARGSAAPDQSLALFDQARASFQAAATADGLPPREASLVELYASMIFTNRRDRERAPGHAREALRIAQRILDARPDDQRARFDVAAAAGQLASALFNTGDEAGSVPYFTLAADMREQIVATDPDNVRARERLALSKGRFGTILARAGDLPAARANIDRAVELYEGLQAAGQLAPTMEADFAEILGHLGDYHQRAGNRPAACAAFRRAVDILQAANARLPLTAFRKEMLDTNREELKKCG